MVPLAPQKTITVPAPRFDFGVTVKHFPIPGKEHVFYVGRVEEAIFTHSQDEPGYWEYWIRIVQMSGLVLDGHSQYEVVRENDLIAVECQ